MPDSRRLLSTVNSGAVDRDSRAEALLVDGLERYFNGQYEEAIHLWTRVLFLDRSHARARAYIDRARTALAERQRQADEMLHATGEWLAQGDADRARALLSEAEASFADDERAADLRLHLERLERLRIGADDRARHAEGTDTRPGAARVAGRTRAIVAAVLVLATLVVVLVTSESARTLMGLGAVAAPERATGSAAIPVALTSAEVALIRARTLVSRGRLSEALRALDRVPADSDERDAAEALRLSIQQLLLAAGSGSRVTDPPGSAGLR